MKKTMAVFITILMLALTGLALAGDNPPMQGRMQGHRFEGPRFGKMLDLTEEQQTQIENSRLQMQKEMLPLRSELTQKRNDLKLLITSDNPNKAQIDKALEGISDVRLKMQQLRINQMLKVRSLLTDAQKQKFDMRILNGGERMHRGAGNMERPRRRPMPHPGMD